VKISTKCSFFTFLDNLLITILLGPREADRDLEREPDLERDLERLEREELEEEEEEEEEEERERDFLSPFFPGLGEREEDLESERGETLFYHF